MTAMTGGCQCGRVRYTAQLDDFEAYLCHCRYCQRATGGVSIGFKNLPAASVTWSIEPDWFSSSPIARRPFCSACGTPLGFKYADSDRIDLTVGSFDDPKPFVPVSNFGIENRLGAWSDTSGLPSHRADTNERLQRRWEDAGAKPAY